MDDRTPTVIELSEDDYRSLETFTLAWRWTEPRFNVLPQDALSDVLANIRPLRSDTAKRIDKRARVFNPEEGFAPGTYELVGQIETSDTNTKSVGAWLREHTPDVAERIIVSWGSGVAVETIAGVFCNYWDDFCYPSSDDVTILPLSEEWMLIYWHEEVFFLVGACADESNRRAG
jgi:hypothetical protein